MTKYLAIDPVDVLALRGNRLFSDGHGEVHMPPWPSVLAGAIRTRILADRGVSFSDLRAGTLADPAVAQALGTWNAPGAFRLAFLGLHLDDHAWLPWPADLVAFGENDELEVRPLEPASPDELGARVDCPAPLVPVLRQGKREKPAAGLWLSAADMTQHLVAHPTTPLAPKRTSCFWKSDPRLGIALDTERRTAREGMLYTTDTIAFHKNVGLLVGIDGADDLIPTDGLLRLGGDGHAARVRPFPTPPIVGAAEIAERFRVVLATPGLFEEGWLPTGVVRDGGLLLLRHGGFAAQLMAAAVPRAEVVSGWDLVKQSPKPAVRVVPAGAVYWFEQVEGTGADRLAWATRVRDHGLWEDSPTVERRRRQSEGFNNVWLGSWAPRAS